MENENGTPAVEAEAVESQEVDLTSMLKFKEEAPAEVEDKPAPKVEPKKEDEKNPSSKEWAAFTKKDKEIREEKQALKKEKEEIEATKKTISDFNTKLELAKKDVSAGIKLFEELTGTDWETYVDWLAQGPDGENPIATHSKKKKEEAEKKAKDEEFQALTTKQRASAKEGLLEHIKAAGEKYELIQSVGAENGVEAVMIKIEEEFNKSGKVPSDETIEKWFAEVEENCGEYLKQVGKSKKARSLFTPSGDEVKLKIVENQPPSNKPKTDKMTLSNDDVSEIPRTDVDINSLPWDKQIEHLSSMLKFK